MDGITFSWDVKKSKANQKNMELASKNINAAVKEADEANSIYWNEMRPQVENFKAGYQQYLREMNNYIQLESNEA